MEVVIERNNKKRVKNYGIKFTIFSYYFQVLYLKNASFTPFALCVDKHFLRTISASIEKIFHFCANF